MPRIESDVNRFRQIVRGRVREELKKHLGRTEMFGKQGDRVVSIPVPHLELPHFVHDTGGKGVGQGDGDAGGGRGPRIQPKGSDELETRSGRYTGISPVGPESLRHFKRSYRQALRRLMSTGVYD